MREKPPSVRELMRRVAELERANVHLRAIAAADRQRADALEDALRRSYAFSTDVKRNAEVPASWRRSTLPAARPCAWCRTTFQPGRDDARFCSNRCLQADYRRRHPRRRQDEPSEARKNETEDARCP